MTVFGRPVYAIKSQSATPRPFVLDADSNEPFDHPIATNGPGAPERNVTLNAEPDILAFASGVSRAFPEIPALGIDIIRDAASGKLYVLEVNASGLTWHISSNYGVSLQRDRKLDIRGQFGALDVISDALIEVTRREAV
jgi:hypothetical protein